MKCPCCGHLLPTQSEICLLPDSHTLVWREKSVKLTPMEMKIALACQRGPIAMDQLIDKVYADDPDGGPDNPRNTICVIQVKLNRKLKPLGLRIGANMRGSKAARHRIAPCE